MSVSSMQFWSSRASGKAGARKEGIAFLYTWDAGCEF